MNKKSVKNNIRLFFKQFRIIALSIILSVALSVPAIPAIPSYAAEFVPVGIGVAEAVGS